MKHLLSILLVALAILAAPAAAQSIKTLGFNESNGVVVANTGTNVLTFTNAIRFDDGSGDFTSISGPQINTADPNTYIAWGTDVWLFGGKIEFSGTNATANAATTRANLGFSTNLNTLWTATNASNARSAVGLGATWLTNTNVTNFRTAVGLGATNDVEFQGVIVGSDLRISNGTIFWGTNERYAPEDNVFLTAITVEGSIAFNNTTNAAATRTNLSLGLAALTNTSNVTMMRALAGSTNTNEPFSGIIAVLDGSTNARDITISNGIIVNIEEP